MEDTLKQILLFHRQLFSTSSYVLIPGIHENSLYEVDNKYIIKICNNIFNRQSFKREERFYAMHENDNNIPRLLTYRDVPCPYMIMEKIEGLPLFKLWDTLTIPEREQLIEDIAFQLDMYPLVTDTSLDWARYISSRYGSLLSLLPIDDLFNQSEMALITKSYQKIPLILANTINFSYIHGNLHFGNIIAQDNSLKFIDFSHSILAPLDYEIASLIRMSEHPWDYTSENVNLADYSPIKDWLFKYCHLTTMFPYIHERLALYEMLYCLEKMVDSPYDPSFKTRLLNSANVVLNYSSLSYNTIKSPQELMTYLNMNMQFGWINQGQIVKNSLKDFRTYYHTLCASSSLKYGVGTCIEQAMIIDHKLRELGYLTKMFALREKEELAPNDALKIHLCVFFKMEDSWYWFEHTWPKYTGIKKVPDIKSGLDYVAKIYQITNPYITHITSIPENLSLLELNQYITIQDIKEKANELFAH